MSYEPTGSELGDGTEFLHRQVNPSWVVDGVPSSQAFRPTKKDEGLLSVSRGSEVSAEESFDHHTGTLGLRSAGAWSVTVDECGESGTQAIDDPTDETPHHAVVDFRGFSRKQAEIAGKRLLKYAMERGCSYTPSIDGF